ncbi:hypothetical protein QBC99_002449 [Beijerinckia sp. GAS462]|nr:hypothetical protein [Beijerinckia sp. GAS462]SEC42938.1 hypothetical protein SAMN05443249_2669 [Beijerinckia sp. 28-YEA-48]
MSVILNLVGLCQLLQSLFIFVVLVTFGDSWPAHIITAALVAGASSLVAAVKLSPPWEDSDGPGSP